MTYFSPSIYLDGNSYASLICAAEETRETALAEAFSSATYYLGHHRRVEASVDEYCAACHGEGTILIRRKRSTTQKRCAACRGHIGALSSIRFPCKPHSNVRTIDNGSGELVSHSA